ncbi:MULTISPECIES: quinone oxidoreductase [unclassified Sphingomonas]|uniref:quinone oxidoreductase family protein n=1 Tax=unclassified Sphingomonas TaxID=196159 RepID=UPI0028558A22|nr:MULTISPECIES: quinone oxidoreductase [unclassified Sphingomonas]MDR6116496.1 NADPH2:quinone reductase [Sphingomonas sp. SORGH_AS_0789]MDR6149829.1 NADPH2:quinone reductase [Sphingomonas sp. SORGH_AS_0742]
MEKTAFIDKTGGPEVIRWREHELPPPGPGEVRMRHHAVGLNYIDTYHRSGLYPIDLPGGLGSEAAGVVEALGEGVTDFAVGDRVGVFGPARGAYATARNVAADLLVPLPDRVDDRTAAAILLKGATTAFLIEDCAAVQPCWPVLVHAAAGGVGHLAVGWLKAIGATVIATVGSEAKAEKARAAGADHVILNRTEDVAARVREITQGQGVPVALDGVGKATWGASLDSMARRGLVVSFGNASGPVDGVHLGLLAAKGSLFVTRPTLFDYAVTAGDKRRLITRVFAMLEKGAIAPEIGQSFALTNAAEAHRAIEAGETVGSTVLIP